MGPSIRDDLVVQAEIGKDVLEKDLGYVRGGGGFVTGAENYPLRKSMVYHDQNGVVSPGDGEVGDQIHGYLLERAGAIGGDRSKGGVGQVGVHFVGLAGGASGNEFTNEGGHPWPPVVFLEEGDGSEVAAVGTGKKFVNVFYEGVPGGFGDEKAGFVIEGTIVEVPVVGGGTGKRDGGGIHGSECIDDELIRGGGFSDLRG